MSEMKWNYGPWNIASAAGTSYIAESAASGNECSVADKEGFVIAITVADVGRNMSLANGNLISAAPELYDALWSIMNTQGGAIPSFLVAPALAALAKARGEA